MAKKTLIYLPPKKPKPYNSILHADFDPDMSMDEIASEAVKRNLAAQIAQKVEEAVVNRILRTIQNHKFLEGLEERVANRVIAKLQKALK